MEEIRQEQAVRVYAAAFCDYIRRGVPENWMRELALSKIDEAAELLEQAINTMRVVVVREVEEGDNA